MATSKRVCIILPPAPGLYDQRSNVPLGPLYVASALEKAGHEVELISLLGRDLPAFWPKADLYAMGFTTPQRDAAIGILALIRSQHPDAVALAGGAHVQYQALDALEAGFDAVLIGEAEITILDVLRDLPNPSAFYHGVPYKILDTVHFPARHLLPHGDLYNSAGAVFLGSHGEGYVASIMASRGCPYHCAFCDNSPLAGMRYRSAGNVVAEMRQLADLGVTNFKFQDDSFTVNYGAVADLAVAAAEEFDPGEISTRMHTHVAAFSEKLVGPLRRLSTEVVAFGIESGSQAVLNLNRKNATVEQAEEALRIARDAGFTTLAHFLFGLPGECERTVEETLEFVRRNSPNLDRLNMSVFVPYPGCDIAENPEKYRVHILEDNWNKFWTTQKRKVLALPYGVSYDHMMLLMQYAFETLGELGYANPEWEVDFAENARVVRDKGLFEQSKGELPAGNAQPAAQGDCHCQGAAEAQECRDHCDGRRELARQHEDPPG